ncbi:MAG TPA: plastocyanin/azurin family copper-binding protein [Casimicrobiaceae bacterium]|nr:plastocyanin/azurin family copper-binding protein [Casimicrobiaceae bacterium]
MIGLDVTVEPALRVQLFAACAVFVALLVAAPASAATFEVSAVMSKDGAQVYFDPVGVRIQPGDTVRWIQVDGYHSVTAYHPANGDRELRIPEPAEPWDTGMLLAKYPAKGSTFEHTFAIPGVYDYLYMPHEGAGMVGRIIVGEPTAGPGTRPFGYAPVRHWKLVPMPAQQAFPAISLISERGAVRARRDEWEIDAEAPDRPSVLASSVCCETALTQKRSIHGCRKSGREQ